MPSPDSCLSSPSGLTLENTGLRGGKVLSQPRRLAITLPGTNWLSSPCMGSHSTPRLSLKPSWEQKSSGGAVTSDLKLTSPSVLSSKLVVTSNHLLNSELSLTSHSSLNAKPSFSTLATDVFHPTLTSNPMLTTPSCLSMSGSHLALTSDVSLPSKLAVTSHPNLLSATAMTFQSSLSPEHVNSHLDEVPNPAFTPHSTNTTLTSLTTSFDPCKSVAAQIPHHPGVTLNLQSPLVVKQEEPGAPVLMDDVNSQEGSIYLQRSQERESLSDEISSPVSETWLSDTFQPVLIKSLKEKKLQILEDESDIKSCHKSESLHRQKKMALISAVCCSLENGPNFSDPSNLTRAELQTLCEELAKFDPEFILKVALYTRQELNIRSTANFLLALSALLPACRPHLRRYFCTAVQLPTDWMEVPKLYQSLAGKEDTLVPLPSCLRRALTLKFKEFTEYQLAKYNTQRQRGKRRAKRQRVSQPRRPIFVKAGRKIRNLENLLKPLQEKLRAPTRSHKKTKDRFSLKSLIQRLHISQPAHHVMSLLGCRYPKDLCSFSRSGLEGPWQSHLSGRRMKLKQPDTWERALSQNGNTGPVWEKLLDSHQVPFMALLRNLRSLICVGISDRHHKEVTARLSSQSAVIKSRQFPFRFLSAYKVIQDLETRGQSAGEPFPSNVQLIRRILMRHNRTIPNLQCCRWKRHQLRACLAIPAVHELVKREKEVLKSRAIKLDQGVLQSYKRALEEAVHISARHNIPPLPGRTVILFCVGLGMYSPCHGASHLSVVTEKLPQEDKKGPPTDAFIRPHKLILLAPVHRELSRDVLGHDTHYARCAPLLEVGLLLSLMVRDTSENAQLVLYNERDFAPAETSSSSLLQNVCDLKRQAEELLHNNNFAFDEREPERKYLLELLAHRTKVDTLLLFTPSPTTAEFRFVLQLYRREINPNCLFVTVLPSGFNSEENLEQCNDVTLCGFTEQVLRYVSERGTARLIDHVARVNERFKVPEDPDNVQRKDVMTTEINFPAPRQRWRSVRIFISSTFRDMLTERDLIIGWVMPELRARAACHYLSIEEVDLRWGITEEEAKKDRQLSLCLSEVHRSQIFIGIMGERYGHVPRAYTLPLLPEYQWIQTYPLGRSITELEAMQFLKSHDSNEQGQPKAFFYFREPDFLRSVPSHWRSDFAAESHESEMRLTDLKRRVTEHPASRSYRYTCQWGGERHGKPFVTGLDDFGAQILKDIWQVIERDFIREGSMAIDEDEEQLAQEAFQEWQARQSCARNKLVLSTCAQILERTRKSMANGRLFLVCGEPSQGKTVLMATLVKELAVNSSVIYHFVGATPGAQKAENMLMHICKQLSLRLNRESSNLTSYRTLLSEFQCLLLLTSRSLRRSDTVTLLIDGADVLCGRAGELTSDWIPQHLPQKVNMVLSMTEGSSLFCSLRRRKDTVLVPLGSLEPPDRAELVRQRLAVYGKKLDESAFNNQMHLLLIKKGTRDPLYLTLACEELRANAVFEELSDDIKKLPSTLPPLIQKRLESLELEHGVTTVTVALTTICLSRNGLRERDLLRILSILQRLSFVYTACWDQMLTAAALAKDLPMATYSQLLRGLRSVLGLWTPTLISDPRLHLTSCILREAVEKRYFVRPEIPKAAHLLMAAHFWTVSSPEDPESAPVLHAECLTELAHHLLCSGQLYTLGKLLAHLPFLQAHATLGLLPHLCQVYSRHAAALLEDNSSSTSIKERDHQALIPSLDAFREFIHRSLTILSQNPSLFRQQALNEPDLSPVCTQAQGIVRKRNDSRFQLTIMWNNKPESKNFCSSKSLEVPSTPGCVSLCPNERLAAVGTSEGSLHLIDTDSGEEVRLLHSGCDGVSACAFISDDLLCVTSYDGTLEIWNIPDGCRMHRVEAHRRQVTGCCVSPDRRHLLTCSLDSQIKLWDTSRGSLLSSSSLPSPLNCATFHPRGHAVAVGSWDGKITVLRLENWKRSAVLYGTSSVKAVSFSQSGNVIVSGSLDGWVSLWAWEAQVLLSHFRAHNGSTLTTNFLQNGEHLLTGGEDGKVQVWSGGLGRLRGQVGRESICSPALSIAVSPSKQLLAVGYHSDCVSVYRVNTGGLFAQCNFRDVAVVSLVWLSDNTLATGTSDSLVRLWDVSAELSQCWLSLEVHQRSVSALAASSQLLASASEDVSICLWSLNTLRNTILPPSPVSVLRGHTAAVTCCSFSHDERLLATGGQDRSVLCWDVSLNPPTLVHTLLSCHRDWVTDCSWTSADMLVSCSGDGSVCLWDIQREECLLEFAGHQSAVSSVVCMGERVITTGRDGTLKVWSLAGLEITNIPSHHDQINHSVAFWESGKSQDDADLVVYTAGSDGSVLKWSPLQMDQIHTLYGHGGAVVSSASGSKCKVVITAAQDGSVRLWGVPRRDGSLLDRHTGAVTAVTWSPDAELMVSGGENGEVIVWKQQESLVTLQCSELCVFALLFTSQRSFCAFTNDQKVSRWILLPRKGGGLRAKKVYSVEVDSLVISVTPSNSVVQLDTVSGNRFLLEPKTGSLQQVNHDALSTDGSLQPPKHQLHPDSIITRSHPDFGMTDSTGGLWLQTADDGNSKGKKDVRWERKQIHLASILCLSVMDDYVITASADRTVKVWERSPFRQVGLFQCEGAVTCLSPSQKEKSCSAEVLCNIVCGDQYGNVYLLTCL
ncbi:telomerase protein component 1 [Rhinophrynus dorsalis]